MKGMGANSQNKEQIQICKDCNEILPCIILYEIVYLLFGRASVLLTCGF